MKRIEMTEYRFNKEEALEKLGLSGMKETSILFV